MWQKEGVDNVHRPVNSLCGPWVILRRRCSGRLLPAGSGSWVDDDGVTETFELGDQASGVCLLVPLLQPLGPEVTVGLVAVKHVIGANKD